MVSGYVFFYVLYFHASTSCVHRWLRVLRVGLSGTEDVFVMIDVQPSCYSLSLGDSMSYQKLVFGTHFKRTILYTLENGCLIESACVYL